MVGLEYGSVCIYKRRKEGRKRGLVLGTMLTRRRKV
jgi:hypothetical protein